MPTLPAATLAMAVTTVPTVRAATFAVAIAAALAGVAGCARVKPWQREHLASPAMGAVGVGTDLEVDYRARLVESRVGGGAPGSAPGGGCGCTQ